LTVNKLSRI